MAYCTLTDINALVPQVPFTDGQGNTPASKPNASSVMGWAEDMMAQMDAQLENLGYDTTALHAATAGVLYPGTMTQLKQVNAFGALGIAQASRATGVNSTLDASGREIKNIWLQRFDDWFKALGDQNNPMILKDAPHNKDREPKTSGEILDGNAISFTLADGFDLDNPNVTRSQVF